MRTLVIGAGVSGQPAARLLRLLGREVRVYDRDPRALAALRDDSFEVHNGSWTRRLLKGVELVVTSPGVPEHTAPIQDSLTAGVPVWSEIELASRHLGDVPVVAVTGTNGKTTVTGLVAAMLREAGLAAPAAGNIGYPLSQLATEALDGGTWDAVVVEASSFQLRFMHTMRARVAIVLNAAEDHLDWHGSFDAYVAAKARLFVPQRRDDLAIFDADDPGAVRVVANAPGRKLPASGVACPEGGVGPDGADLELGSGIEIPRPALDRYYLLDVVAAGAAAAAMGADAAAIAAAVAAFGPGEHRRQLVGTWDGVAWVNDSKATNPHAAVASAAARPAVILIAGGDAKGVDLRPLVAIPTVRRILAIGEAAPELARLGGELVTVVGTLDAAVTAADEIAQSGDTVLLAPGCASFDQFPSYRQRGADFVAAVRRRKEAAA